MKMSNIKVLIGANRTSSVIQNLQIDAVSNGATPYPQGEYVIYPIFEQFLTVAIAKDVVDEDGEVTDFEVFFEISSVDDLVPADLLNSKDDEENIKTWAQWCKSNHQPVTKNERIFVSCMANSGKCIPFSEVRGLALTFVHKNDIPSEVIEEEV